MLLAAISAAPLSNGDTDVVLSVPILKEGRTLVSRWMGLYGMPDAIWLQIGGCQVFVADPKNLLDHVDIRTSEDALSFVRLFSGEDSRPYLRPDGLVEVPIPAASKRPKVFKQAAVRERAARGAARDCLSCGKQFEITRVMVSPDLKALEVTELVTERGYYALISSEVLVKDASKVGLFYPHH